MLISGIKPQITNTLENLMRPFGFVHPNVITLLGLIPPIAFLLFVDKFKFGWAFFALLASTFDSLDGALARATGKSSQFGALLDSSLDRVSDSLYICAFGFAQIISWPLTIINLVAAFLISYLRTRAEAAGNNAFKLDIGIMQRSERTFFLGLALICLIFKPQAVIGGYYLVEIVFIIMAILSCFTVLQRYFAAYKLLK